MVVVGLLMSSLSPGYGSEYIVALLGLELQDGVEYSNTIEYEVVLTNPGDAPIDVEFYDIEGLKGSRQVTPGVADTMSFTQEASLNGSEIANKTIRVTSDDEFLLQVFVHSSDHLEGYLGIPVTHLGTLYRVSTFCALGGYCQLAIAATQPNTTKVYLQLPENLPDIVFCIDKKYFRSKRDRYLTLKEYDILQIEIAGDFSGALIYSDQPVAVFAGTRNLTLGGTMGHLVEQLVPVHRWGNEFILGTLGDNMYGDLVKITAAEADTLVEVSGFPKFVISNINHTVTKRLDAGTVGYIKANKPVQIVQFSGITYATNGETPRPSMTVVPSTHNFQKKYVLSCGKNAVHSADYHTAVHKIEDSAVTVTDATDTDRPLTYTKYNVKKSAMNPSPSSFTFTAETTGELPFGGILTCNKTAAMPMTFVKQNETSEAEVDTSRCVEDETFYAYYDIHNTKRIITKDVNISNYDLIKLRVKTCGHAIVVLESGSSKTVLTMTPATIVATKCNPNCDTTVKFTDDTYNKNNDKTCTVDMSFYWIYGDKVNQKVCLGYGPYPDTTDCSRELANGFLFTNMQLSMVSSNVFYSYDLHVGNCDAIQSDWRCEDNVDNCHRYKKEICTDNKYGQWVMDNCRRYCGKCQSDIYGRRFLVILPGDLSFLTPIEKCELYVTALGGDLNVAVGSTAGIIPGVTVDKAVVYDCKAPKSQVPFTVIADQDVHVTVVFKKGNYHGTYQVYPVDAIGKEMLGITDDSTVDCFFATVDYPAKVTAFYEGSRSWGPSVGDGESFTLDPGDLQRIGASALHVFKGVLFRSSRPIYMFCGESFQTDMAGFYQIPPTASLGKEFVTPGFEPVVVQRPFDATLRIQADSDNTLVTLAGDFDAIIPIYKRGDYHDQQIEAGTSYRLTSNNNINVALILVDVYDVKRRSFSFLPPYSTTTTKQSVYIPLYSGVEPIMKAFEPKKLQSYYIHTSKTSSLSNILDVTDDMLIHHVISDSSENYYTVSVVFNNANNWVAFAGPRVFNSGQYSIEMSLCQTRINTVADGLDNDCDGLTDEDVCFSAYGNDYDLDGGFGEDCGTVDTDSTGPPLPADPQCIPINKPDEQCWTIGFCKCSWVEAIEIKEGMTEEEIKEKEEEDIERYKEALQVDTEVLSSETSKKESADDVRQSAANIGYLGITLFALVFGGLVLMDIKSIVRDVMIFCCNVKEGIERLWDFINGEDM